MFFIGAMRLAGAFTGSAGAETEECLYVGSGKARVGQQRYVVVNGPAAYAVTVGKLALGMIFWNVDHEVNLVAPRLTFGRSPCRTPRISR